jgi:SET domain-containing protein
VDPEKRVIQEQLYYSVAVRTCNVTAYPHKIHGEMAMLSIVAMREIEKDEELFMAYCASYWLNK